jgi:hypothetical protein
VINWTLIESLLHRDRASCHAKYQSLHREKDFTLTTGPFDDYEDDIVRERIEMFGSEKAKDLWMVLSAELNREERTIRQRWRIIKGNESGTHHKNYWNEEMVSRFNVDFILFLNIVLLKICCFRIHACSQHMRFMVVILDESQNMWNLTLTVVDVLSVGDCTLILPWLL